MSKVQSGKHSANFGKPFLVHHSGKWAQVAVRFSQKGVFGQMPEFSRPVSLLVPLSFGPYLSRMPEVMPDGDVVTASNFFAGWFLQYLAGRFDEVWDRELDRVLAEEMAPEDTSVAVKVINNVKKDVLHAMQSLDRSLARRQNLREVK